MTKRSHGYPPGLWWDPKKGPNGGCRPLPGFKSHRGMGGPGKSCGHCGSLLAPRKIEEVADVAIDDLDFEMFTGLR